MVAIAFFIYASTTTENYRELRIGEVSKTVAYESERVGRVITEMERNAVDLALAGRQFFISGEHHERIGESLTVENFNAFRSAVGGGIWFEPYALNPDIKRVSYYAFFNPDTDTVHFDPEFNTEEYDFHTQMWYKTIVAELDGPYDIVWTLPYFDDAGTNALMTTVGAGIRNDRGKLVGISTVDWEMQSMVDRLTAIKPTENSFVLIASPKDDYIISSTYSGGPEQTGSSLQDLPWFNELHFDGTDTVGIGNFSDNGISYISFSRLLGNGWLFSIQIPSSEIFSEVEARNNQFIVIMVILLIVMLFAVAFLLNHLINRPLSRLTSGVAELGKGNLDKQIDLHSEDEFGALAETFNKMTTDLKTSIEQSARERAEKERIGAELNVAKQIQISMLPCIFPAFPNRDDFDIYASMESAKEVGGDFYDFFLLDDERTLVVAIADVSGKGVPAALFMVITKTLIKNNAQNGKSPKEVFETVNNLLCENNEANMFATAFLGYLDIPSGKFTFVNAGHNPPLLRTDGSFKWLKEKPGFILGGMEDMTYTQHEVRLMKNDELFLYTDGLTEAANNENKLFSSKRLLETANSYLDLPLKDFTESVKKEIDTFADGAIQADDITMLIMRYKGGG